MKEQLSFWSFILLVLLEMFGGDLYAQTKDVSKKGEERKQSKLYLRAPEVVPGTLPEMRQTSYWISKMKNPDEVVLSLNEIERRNAAYKHRMEHLSELDSTLVKQINKHIKERPGLLAHFPDLGSMTPSKLAELTKQMVQSGTDYLRSTEFGNIMAISYSDKELDAIELEISYDPERSKPNPKKGIVTTQSRLHIIPPIKPEYIGLFTNGKERWDLWNLDVLPLGTTVDILYTSKSNAFLFVLSERGYGWVPSENIGIGSSSEIDVFGTTNDFIVCTGDRVPFYTDSNYTAVSGWLRMGDCLPIVSNDSKVVKIPFRNANGKFSIQEAYLKSDADVHLGYLPYTRNNIVVQAFKLLDNLYDWTGAWYGRNHVTNLRDIFKSFGFQLPANGALLSAFSAHVQRVKPSVGRKTQVKTILSIEPFLTIQICENSHSQLYMGDHNSMPIGFDAHGYSYKDEKGNDLELKRWVVGTIEIPDYFLKQEITFVKLY